MSHESNHYGEALAAIETAEANQIRAEHRDYLASLAAAKASIAVCDAVLALRDEVEAMPTRIARAISDG